MKNNKAFTLVELMLVVIIISVLAAMVVPRLTGRSEEAKKGVAKADIEVNLATAIKLYELDNGKFPPNLDALMTNPGSSEAPSWKGPYIEKKALDPWTRPYVYKFPGTHRAQDYDLSSTGRDGVESADDVVNWEN